MAFATSSWDAVPAGTWTTLGVARTLGSLSKLWRQGGPGKEGKEHFSGSWGFSRGRSWTHPADLTLGDYKSFDFALWVHQSPAMVSKSRENLLVCLQLIDLC